MTNETPQRVILLSIITLRQRARSLLIRSANTFGVLGMGSAATRWGALGARIDDLLYGGDLLLTPLARQHAVHLNVYRRPS